MEIKNSIYDSISQSANNAMKKLQTASQRLSTGLRINSASDDAANLALSQMLEMNTRGANSYMNNARMEQAMLKVADSDLSVISDNNLRIRDLALQAANGVYGDSERKIIQNEINQLNEENQRIAQSSSFNGINLLDGSAQGHEVMVTESDSVQVSAFTSAMPTDLGINNVNVSDATSALKLVEKIDSAMTDINSRRSELGALSNRMDGYIERNRVTSENLTAANSTIRDTDIATTMTDLLKAKIQMSATVAMQSQANLMSKTTLNLLRTTSRE